MSNGVSIVGNGLDEQGAFPVVGTDGTLYIFWVKEQIPPSTGATLMMRKSTNGGQSFTSGEQAIVSGITNPETIIMGGQFPKAHCFPSAVVNPADGSINVVYGNNTDIYLIRSTNNGTSWSTPATKGLRSGTQAWNPSITCNNSGTLAIVYYTAPVFPNNPSCKVFVGTGKATDASFTVYSQSATAFNPTTWKYSDYIGIASNSYTYWAVWPQAVGSGAQIWGRYRTVSAIVENLNSSYSPISSSQVKFDGTWYNSPYTTSTFSAGKTYAIEAKPTLSSGKTYYFQRWEDELHTTIGTTTQLTVNIDNHRYSAIYAANAIQVGGKK